MLPSKPKSMMNGSSTNGSSTNGSSMNGSAARGNSEGKQTRRLVLALVLLLTALLAVIIRDRDFWFGSDDSTLEAEATPAEVTPQTVTKSTPSANPTKPATPAAKNSTAKTFTHPRTETQTKEATQSPAPSNNVTRTVLPPLDVEVVAGESHRTVRPGTNAMNVEITKSGSAAASQTLAAATNAADRERISGGMGSYEATYPLLAQHMNVEGSVVLQALISTDGIIQNLRVLSGPAILASAAQQAVREWKFKPVVQNGEAVETKAKITVNFAIKVADNSSKDQIASNMPLRYSYSSDGGSR
jgi:periplasmic protein TonB